MQVPEKDKEQIQRSAHGVAALTVNFDCVDIILFGGYDDFGYPIAEVAKFRFGMLVY